MEMMLSSHVYLISALLCLMLLIWHGQNAIASTLDLMLKRTVLSFGISFFLGALIRFVGNSVKAFSFAIYSLEYLFVAGGVYFWCVYIETLLSLHSCLSKHKRTVTLLFFLPVLLTLSVNLFTPILFRFDTEQRFCRLCGHTIYFVFLFLCAARHMLCLLKQAKHEGEPLRKRSLCMTALLPVAVLFNALWKASINRIWPVACVLTAFVLLCIFMSRTREQISIDALTQVNNRHNLMGFLEYKLRNASGDKCLIMIDIDDFKHINDTYGHLEGDRALMLTAAALKRACGPFPKRPYIARYGGDEFIIIMDGGLAEAETLIGSINSCIGKTSIGNNNDMLAISAGISLYVNGFDAKKWIADADSKLYAVKHSKGSVRTA